MGVKVGLIEPDGARRAALSRKLAEAGFDVEPFASAKLFGERCSETGLAVLVADERVDALSIRDGLLREGAWRAIIAYAPAPSAPRIVQFLRGGGYDYLAEPVAPGALSRSVLLLDAGRSAYAAARCRAARARIRLAGLSPREAAVLASMAQGRSNKKTALELGISPRTVEIHRANMLAKMGAQCSVEALQMYYEDALLNAEASAPGR